MAGAVRDPGPARLAKPRHIIAGSWPPSAPVAAPSPALTGVLLGRLGLLALRAAVTVPVALVLVSNEGLDALSARARLSAIQSGYLPRPPVTRRTDRRRACRPGSDRKR